MKEDIQKSASKRASTREKAPPRTAEAQEQLMINLSMNQAEQMLREGRAPAQVVVHFLKLATEKAKFENEKLKADAELAKSKSEAMKAQSHSEELYENAIRAFKSYGGGSPTLGGRYEDEEEGYYD